MKAKPVVDCYFYSQQHYFYNVVFVLLGIKSSKLHLSVLNFFCYPFHFIECSNNRLSNFVVWFSTWSSLIVITDEGRNPKTGWFKFFVVSPVSKYKYRIFCSPSCGTIVVFSGFPQDNCCGLPHSAG